MNQNQIDTLLQSFFISQIELENRKLFKEFANSLSDIFITEFAQNYILNNPSLSAYLGHTDGSMLFKKIQDFLTSVFTQPINKALVDRIYFIGSVHYSIKLDPAKVSYGFWALNEILNKLASTNELVKEHRLLISKLLRFVEHLMNEGYYLQRNKQNSTREDFQGFHAQNELYIGFNVHKINMKKITLAIENKNIKFCKDIENNHQECPFGKVLTELNMDKKYEYVLGFNVENIEKLHEKWHQEYIILKDLIQSDSIDVAVQYKKLETVTDELKVILDRSLQSSLEDGHLSLNSGIRAMKKMTNLFYDKSLKNIDANDMEKSLRNTIEDTILLELSWVVEKLSVQGTPLESENYEVHKHIRYKMQDIYIGIKIEEKHNSSYVIELITLLLEVLHLHLTVKEREVSLVEFADKAEHASKSKDMFLANMSHELRTPLNAITGFSQILMMKKDTSDSVKKYIEKINVAGNNLLDLVNTILDFAKLEAGKMQFNPSLSNISLVIHEVQTIISFLAKKKNITLHIPNIISLNLYIDKVLFKQVLINLLTNAIKFTPENGEVSLTVVYDADKHKYIFEVKDNGIGIPAQDTAKLFQAFSQLDNSYQKEHKGTGLGLMISKKIIEDLHNGSIWVKSVEGEGSSFFLAMATPMVESHTYRINEAPAGSKHILIVEDNESYQKLLIENLQSTHQLTLTDTINKTKDLLTKETYDFIILDFFLTDGISSEVLQFMEEEDIKIPTIIVSAEDEINISSSLVGSSNLESIMNKKDIIEICASLRGEAYSNVKSFV